MDVIVYNQLYNVNYKTKLTYDEFNTKYNSVSKGEWFNNRNACIKIIN